MRGIVGLAVVLAILVFFSTRYLAVEPLVVLVGIALGMRLYLYRQKKP